ncbi:magnesium chelatase subunit D family protein [Cumulibacter soli]|uniref:magnesium chelatase subunit D family protein n=1 Tax=Cumulibacter soli TaxID=2546344 RepID=UPI001067B431|nr:magnesium chelatase subunit D family protein [Cumulibacter soli]
MQQFPFSAIVGADDMALALILTSISPDVGGVLVRGEKGTAKSTMVRALAEVLPRQQVIEGCRFGCDPHRPDPSCPDRTAHLEAASEHPARLVELPVGASEDRVVGSLDLRKALGDGRADFDPGLLAQANRGILYVDEVNLLHDHLVDVLLDAAAMGRNTVERDGISVSHEARIVLVGTMNPEEGELRPQLLDRFGLTVEIAASRDPQTRVEVVRRRLAFDSDPQAFTAQYADAQTDLRVGIERAQALLTHVDLPITELERIARVCAGFDVDGMRADIVTARTAKAHAAWFGRDAVNRDDVRAAARLALPHRRRRNPFDAPGLDENLLEELLGDDEPTPPEDDPNPPEDPAAEKNDEDAAGQPPAPDQSGTGPQSTPDQPETRQDSGPQNRDSAQSQQSPDDAAQHDHAADEPGPVPVAIADTAKPYTARNFTIRGLGNGQAGRRSRALTENGRTIAATTENVRRLHLPATITAAARARIRSPYDGRLRLQADDLRGAVTQGRESNLVLLAVDASGSMGAKARMQEVKAAVLSLLIDAYRKRDRVGLVTFRGHDAELSLSPTSSVEAAERCLRQLPHGGRTPLAEGLEQAAHTLRVEHIRDPRRRALLVLLTDGRATSGKDALARAQRIADAWPGLGVDSVVIDCETGKFRLGLAADLAARMGATYVPLPQVAADAIVDIVHNSKTDLQKGRAA